MCKKPCAKCSPLNREKYLTIFPAIVFSMKRLSRVGDHRSAREAHQRLLDGIDRTSPRRQLKKSPLPTTGRETRMHTAA